MDYKQKHLYDWLKEHSLLNISGLERESGIPKGTIRHFMKERQNLPPKHFEGIETTLSGYGYSGSDNE